MNIEAELVTRRLAAVALAGIISASVSPMCQPQIAGESAEAAVPQSSSAPKQPGLPELFNKLAQRHRWQANHLDRFSVVKTYTLEKNKNIHVAEEVVRMEYRAPKTETFAIISGKGSGFVRHRIFQRLIKNEVKRIKSNKGTDSLITSENYSFEIIGRDQIGGAECTVVRAHPKRKETDLFEGKIWIDEQDFAIVQITGQLAKSPSFWIKRVDFVRRYERIGGFWLLLREEATVNVRIYGRRQLTIDYRSYMVNGVTH